MAFHIVKRFFLFFTLSFLINNYSYIHKINIYENNQLFCLGDIHLGMNDIHTHPELSNKSLFKIHRKQATDIINFIQNNQFKNALLIIEDTYDINDEKYKQRFINDRQNALNKNYSAIFDFLNESCIKHNIEFVNAEFRQISHLFFTFNEIQAWEFLNNLQKTKEEFLSYNDNDQLNEYYENKINSFFTTHKSFIKFLEKNKSKFKYQIIDENNETQMNNFYIDYIRLLDLKIVHTIFQNRSKNIFLCVGSSHIERLQNLFKQIGYKQIYEKEYSHLRPLNINKILNKFSLNVPPSLIKNITFDNQMFLIIIILFDILIKSGYIFISRKYYLMN